MPRELTLVGPSWVAWCEVEVLVNGETVSMEDAAVTASNVYAAGGAGYQLSNVIDGNSATTANTGQHPGPSGQWVAVDLGHVVAAIPTYAPTAAPTDGTCAPPRAHPLDGLFDPAWGCVAPARGRYTMAYFDYVADAASPSGGGAMTPRVRSGAEREAQEDRARREEREAMEEYDRMMMGEAGPE